MVVGPVHGSLELRLINSCFFILFFIKTHVDFFCYKALNKREKVCPNKEQKVNLVHKISISQ